jgi:hypothetical protein
MTLPASQEIDQIRTKGVQLLYQHLTIGLVATSINAVILTLVLWSRISHSILIFWLVFSESIALLRYGLLLRYRKSGTTETSDLWGQWFLTGTILAGICWGSAAILMFPVESIPHQAFLAFVLGGMATGAVTAYSVKMGVFLAFTLPALPIAVRFSQGDELHLAMGAMASLFIIWSSIAHGACTPPS